MKFFYQKEKKDYRYGFFQRKLKDRGFTLIEMIVSLGMFTIVLFLATSALLSVINVDRKSRATRIAVDNINLTLENMSRRIKTGTLYNCGGGLSYNDCATPQSAFAFLDQNGSRTIYKRAQGTGTIVDGSGCGPLYKTTQGCVLRSDSLGGIFMSVTSPEIDITSLKFWVSGSAPWGTAAGQDKKQPTVAIAIEGSLGMSSANLSGGSSFRIQTALTQRAYDN